MVGCLSAGSGSPPRRASPSPRSAVLNGVPPPPHSSSPRSPPLCFQPPAHTLSPPPLLAVASRQAPSSSSSSSSSRAATLAAPCTADCVGGKTAIVFGVAVPRVPAYLVCVNLNLNGSIKRRSLLKHKTQKCNKEADQWMSARNRDLYCIQ